MSRYKVVGPTANHRVSGEWVTFEHGQEYDVTSGILNAVKASKTEVSEVQETLVVESPAVLEKEVSEKQKPKRKRSK